MFGWTTTTLGKVQSELEHVGHATVSERRSPGTLVQPERRFARLHCLIARVLVKTHRVCSVESPFLITNKTVVRSFGSCRPYNHNRYKNWHRTGAELVKRIRLHTLSSEPKAELLNQPYIQGTTSGKTPRRHLHQPWRKPHQTGKCGRKMLSN